MKNYKQLMQALLKGKQLKLKSFNTLLHLNSEGRLCLTDSEGTSEFSDNSIVHLTPTSWEVYEQIRWYDNIPEGGILCWVSDSKLLRDGVTKIVSVSNNSDLRYRSSDNQSCCIYWRYAVPLTPKEVKEFYRTALELPSEEQK